MVDTAVYEVRADAVRPGDVLMSGRTVVAVAPCGRVLDGGGRSAVDVMWDQPVHVQERFVAGEWEPRWEHSATHGRVYRAADLVRVVRRGLPSPIVSPIMGV